MLCYHVFISICYLYDYDEYAITIYREKGDYAFSFRPSPEKGEKIDNLLADHYIPYFSNYDYEGYVKEYCI